MSSIFEENMSTYSSSSDESQLNDLDPISNDPDPLSSFLINNPQTSLAIVDTEPARFSTINLSSMADLVQRKDQRSLRDHGGVGGIVVELDTDTETGILGDRVDNHERRETFGSNRVIPPQHNLKCCFGLHFAWESIKDAMILVLFICSLLSLVLGIQNNGVKRGWQEGVARLGAIVAVVVISSAGNFWPTFQCLKFSDMSSRIPHVDVVRSGKWQQIPISNVVVGDIVFLKPGDQVPADGLFIEGCSLHVETPKTSDGQVACTEDLSHDNPFLSFGGTVVNGYAKMVVTSVGKNKQHHTISFRGTLVDEMNQVKFVVEKIVKVVACINFVALLVRFVVEDYILDKNGNDWAAIVRIVATPVMIAFSSSPEGLLIAVKIGFAYSIKWMMGMRILVRDPSVCHSVASVTTLCVNKTGTLTMDYMEVDKFWQGLNSIEHVRTGFIAPNVLELLRQGIGLNTTQPPSRSTVASATNSTDKAIFDWALRQLSMDVEALKRNYTILEVEPFNSKKRSSGVLISKNSDNTIHLHRKGAPDVIIPMCSHYYESTGIVKMINRSDKVLLVQILKGMAENGLRCFALAHRKTSTKDYFTFSGQKLILLGFVGLKNTRRSGTRETVDECRRAGVNLKLITGDSPMTARVIAASCGILERKHRRGEVVQGKHFRALSPEERIARVDNIKVLASATPEDKFLMVQCLKMKGHVVACLGQGIGDVMALREANVPICFGTEGAEIAKANSAIVLSCKEFVLITNILMWGRGLYDTIQIYAQFLITATFVALIVEFVKSISNQDSNGKVPYPVFELLWVKLITGTFSALALTMKPPAEGVMRSSPTSRKHPLITSLVRTNICIQVLYQVSLLLTIHFKGESIFSVDFDKKEAMIFNTYILCQVFAMFDTSLSETSKIFEEIQKNKVSWGIMVFIILVQFLMIEVLKKLAGTVRLGWGLWAVCTAVAAPSFLLSRLARNLSALSNVIDWPKWKPKSD